MSTVVNKEISALVKSLKTKVNRPEGVADRDEARKVLIALEKPEEVIMRYANVILAERVSLKLGVDLNIFQLLASAPGSLTSMRLAEQIGAE
ncbi:MAG: hypothetical protein Q9160_006195 [Pyrenula sp. 1 TL-2023]